jgi:hypothetical protein
MRKKLVSRKLRMETVHTPDIAYRIPLIFGLVLEARKSANAWWLDQLKVQKLIAAFCIGSTIPEACSYAQITVRQYKYFVKEHPEFSEARKGYILEPGILAQKTVVKALSHDPKIAWKWLERKYPEEFGRLSRRRKQQSLEQPFKTQQQEWDEMSSDERRALKNLQAARLKRIKDGAKKSPAIQKPLPSKD